MLRLAIALGVLFALSPGTLAQGDDPTRPNILLLLSDDAGFADFGFQAKAEEDLKVLTPNIDALAAQGMVFTDFHTSASVCSPSRAGLLSGRHQQEFGHEQNLPPGSLAGGIALGGKTLPARLQSVGYETYCVGKWHLGYRPEDHPMAVGFDGFYGCLQGSRSYWPLEKIAPYDLSEGKLPARLLLDGRTPTPEEGYVTDRLGQAAIRFLERDHPRPFFLYVSFTAPHSPLEAKPEDLELPEIARIEKQRRRKYAGLVKALDDNVGRILASLEALGLADNTLVLFTNDNGGQTQTGAVNTPLRGRKGSLFEGGIRVPCAVRWPGRVQPGTRCDQATTTLDLAPTFLLAADGAAEIDGSLAGTSLLGVLTKTEAELPERTLYWRQSGKQGPLAVRRGRWKLLRLDRSQAPILFDLQADIGESDDMAAQHPRVVADLLAQGSSWEAGLVEPLWGMSRRSGASSEDDSKGKR